MNTLGVPLKERVISRVVFYICVGFTMWILNKIVPDPISQSYAQWENMETATPLIAVPLSDLSFIPPSR